MNFFDSRKSYSFSLSLCRFLFFLISLLTRPGIAMTRAKRNSVRRPTRPGDFEFDYGDSTDFDEDEDGERARPTRALLERQRNLRASDGGLTEESGEGERVQRGEMTGRSAGRKRTSGATENAASQKRRRRNQTVRFSINSANQTQSSLGLVMRPNVGSSVPTPRTATLRTGTAELSISLAKVKTAASQFQDLLWLLLLSTLSVPFWPG